MRDLSQEFYCAGWLTNLEYGLWRAIDADAEDDPEWTIAAHWRQALLELSAVCDGWWRWDAAAGQECFVPLNEWKSFYNHTKEQVT